MKTSELIGPALDWAVAKCEGWTYDSSELKYIKLGYTEWNYSTNWEHGGPIIEREGISINQCTDKVTWFSTGGGYAYTKHGPTPLIAAMRCFVSSKLGDEVDIPKELM